MKAKFLIRITQLPQFRFSSITLTFILFFLFTGLQAQDLLVLKSGEEVKAKIIEISESEVKYQQIDQPDGPTRTILKNDIFMIKYQNGTKEVFSNTSTTPSNNRSTSSPQPQPNNRATGAKTGQYSDTTLQSRNKQKFGGPRIGVTHITAGSFANELIRRGKNPTLMQFGWQFEQRFFSIENGPTGLVEFVPLIAGFEQGLFLPSASLLIGIRGSGDQSLELGIGPNLSVGGLGMVFAFGMNFRTENINFPVNVAFVPSVGSRQFTSTTTSVIEQSGHRITLLLGFNLRRK